MWGESVLRPICKARIIWLISPKSSKKLKKDDLIGFDCDFGNAGSFTEILGITVILTNAPASNCGSGLLQSLRRVTYISDMSKKEKIWSQKGWKRKKKRKGRRRGERSSCCWGEEQGQIKNAEFQRSSCGCTGLLALTCYGTMTRRSIFALIWCFPAERKRPFLP